MSPDGVDLPQSILKTHRSSTKVYLSLKVDNTKAQTETVGQAYTC